MLTLSPKLVAISPPELFQRMMNESRGPAAPGVSMSTTMNCPSITLGIS